MKSAVLAAVMTAGLATLATQPARAADLTESYGGRQMVVHVPDRLPPTGSRALVVVLHGGLGYAQRILRGGGESALNMNGVADKAGFVVAYLNGTPVTRRLGDQFLGWNAGGGCCGVPAETHVDDVSYIKGAVDELAGRYGIDRARVFGMGHSNGAMMTQRLVCETHLYAGAVAVSGPLNLDVETCPAAKGARVLAIHGAEDENVPVAGGAGHKGRWRTVYESEARSKRVMAASGSDYRLEIVPGADHRLADIEAVIEKTEGRTLQDKAARFFGLL